MKKYISMMFTILVIVVFVAIQVKNSSGPEKYSRNLIREYESVQDHFLSLDGAIDSRSYVTLKMLKKKVLVQISRSVEKIDKMGDFEGDDQFRLSVLKLMDFYERFLQNDLTELLDICMKERASRTDYDKSRLEYIKDDFVKREEKYMAEVLEAEEAFARKHDIADKDSSQREE